MDFNMIFGNSHESNRISWAVFFISAFFLLFASLTQGAQAQPEEEFNTIFNDGDYSASARVLKRKTREHAPRKESKRAASDFDVSAADVSAADVSAADVSAADVSAAESAAVVRFDVYADGLYQVNAFSIATATGESLVAIKNAIKDGMISLSSSGQPVSWEAAPQNKAIRFYGKAPEENPYTATSVYWLELGRGETIVKRQTDSVSPVDEQVISAQVHLEQDEFANLDNATRPDSDYWRWATMKGGASWNSVTATVDLHNVAATTAILTVDLQSIRDVTNSIIVEINNTQLDDSITWDGVKEEHSGEVTIPAGLLQEGSNMIILKTQEPAIGTSYVYLDGMTLSYERLAVARNGIIQAQASADGVLSFDGFGNGNIAVYELAEKPVRLDLSKFDFDKGPAGRRVTFSATPGTDYLAVEAGAESDLDTIAVEKPRYQASDSVDYLLIANSSMEESANALAEFRTGSGLTTRVVWTDDIDITMNHGNKHPENIRKFIGWAAINWGVSYVVLAGDACHDYRNLLGLCENLVSTMLVPTPYGLYACDSCLGDTDGDTRPDVYISRIPAQDDTVLLGYIAKLAEYEKTSHARKVLLVAGRNDPDAGYFKQDARGLAKQLATDASGVVVEELYLDDVDISTAQTTFRNSLSEDGLWNNFIGHGGGTTLGKPPNLIDVKAGGASALISGSSSGVFSAMTCAAARHDSPYFSSVAEELVLYADGGPVVAYAPSGLSLNGDAVKLNSALLDEVFVQNSPNMGKAVAGMLKNNTGTPAWMHQIYQIIGDVYTEMP